MSPNQKPEDKSDPVITAWVTIEQKEQIEILAQRHGTSVSKLAGMFIEAGLAQNRVRKKEVAAHRKAGDLQLDDNLKLVRK